MFVAELAKSSHRLVEEQLRRWQITLLGDDISEQEQGVGSAPGIPELAMECDPLLGPQSRGNGIATLECELGFVSMSWRFFEGAAKIAFPLRPSME